MKQKIMLKMLRKEFNSINKILEIVPVKGFCFTLICLFSLSSCILLGRSVNVEIGGNYHKLGFESYAILPFIDKRNGMKNKLGYNPADVMTDSFETAFIGTGSKVVDRRDIENALDELKFSHGGDVNSSQIKEIGQLTNSDVIIMGKIRQFQNAVYNNRKNPEDPSKCTTISYSVKAVHVETGELLWTGSFTQSTGIKDDFLFSCECDVLKYSDEAAKDIIKKITKKIAAKKEE